MKKYLFMAVVVIATLSSCSNDNEFEKGSKKGIRFTATIENTVGSRAAYNSTDKCAEWESGDQISINGKAYSAETAGATTTFTAVGDDATGDTYNAYFACVYDGVTASLPSEIYGVEGKFNMPMYATSSNTKLQFKNLCGVLKITVTYWEMDEVQSIKVSSSNCATSGAFTVKNDAAVLTEPNAVDNTVTVTYNDAVYTTDEGVVFYVAIPAQTYRNLKIEVSDGMTTKSMTTKWNADITIARNTIYPITFADNAITGTAYRNGGYIVNWVQLWPGGPKWAEYNVGAEQVGDYGLYY